MKITTLTLILTSSLCLMHKVSNAQAPNWLWANSAGGTKSDGAFSIAADVSGNSYTAGYYNSATITFGSTTLTNKGYSNVFLTKYDANGSVLWAKSAGGTYYDYASSVVVDTHGNTYVAGYFSSPTITFDTITLTNTSADTNDIFLAKYDVNGNVLWAKRFGGAGNDYASSIALDASGNVYMAGWFYSSTIAFGSTVLTNTGGGYDNILLAKFDSSGTALMAANAGGTGYDGATSVAVDASGNIYIIGDFTSPTLVFGATTLSNASTLDNSDIFLVKYDANLNVLWAKSAGATGNEEVTSVAVDASGNTSITGWFDSPTLDFGSTALINAGLRDIYIAKYDNNGNVLWAKRAGGTYYDYANAVAVDTSGNIYLAGYFLSSSITFGSTVLTNVETNNTDGDLFLVKYDSNGNVKWARGAGGTGNDVPYSVAVDISGDIFLAGDFTSPSLTMATTTLINADNTGFTYDMFIAKIGSGTVGINELSNQLNISVFPNPSTDNITISNSQKLTIEILNVEGQIIKSVNADESITTIDISCFARGMYFVKITDGNGVEIKKIIKQ